MTSPPTSRQASMDNRRLHGSRRSIEREHGFEPVRVEGSIPAAMRGTLMRNGPALFEHGGRRHKHLFEGDGAVLAVNLSNDGARCAHRLIQSEELRQERHAQKPLYGSAAPWHRRMRNLFAGRVKNSGNTNVWHWQNRTFALMEMGPPTEFEAKTLETVAPDRFGGLITAGFSAHPHHNPARRADYNFGLVPGRRPHIQLFEFPWSGPPRVLGQVALSQYVMMHDFIATTNYLVFFIGPARLNLLSACLGTNDLDKLFRYDASAGTEIVVVPIDEPTNLVRFTVDAFWQWHFAGAYEQSDHLVIDFVKHPDLESLKTVNAVLRPAPERLTRARLQPRNQTIQMEQLWESPCEYPRIDPRYEAKEHRYIFLTHDAGNNLLSRFDTQTGKANVWTLPATQVPSELVVVPRSPEAPEGDGYAMSLVYDEVLELSRILVMDTERFEEGPLATIHLEHQVPLTFHGVWIPESENA